MTIVSTNVGLTDTAEGTDYNNLRADLLENHVHDGTSGPAVDHSDLIHPDSYSIINEHEAVDGHIAAIKNIHGKGTTVGDEFIPGIIGGDMTIMAFSGQTTQSIGDSGKTEWVDLPATMANDQYKVFVLGHQVNCTYALTSRETTRVQFTITKPHGGDLSSGSNFHVLVIGVPARP